jgi:hypothetical protein
MSQDIEDTLNALRQIADDHAGQFPRAAQGNGMTGRRPVVGSLCRGRDHRGHQDQQVNGNPGRDQRCGEPAEGLGDDK